MASRAVEPRDLCQLLPGGLFCHCFDAVYWLWSAHMLPTASAMFHTRAARQECTQKDDGVDSAHHLEISGRADHACDLSSPTGNCYPVGSGLSCSDERNMQNLMEGWTGAKIDLRENLAAACLANHWLERPCFVIRASRSAARLRAWPSREAEFFGRPETILCGRSSVYAWSVYHLLALVYTS